jgi:hypothetical protein
VVRSSRLGLTWCDASRLEGCPHVKRALTKLSGGHGSGSAAGLVIPGSGVWPGGSSEGRRRGRRRRGPRGGRAVRGAGFSLPRVGRYRNLPAGLPTTAANTALPSDISPSHWPIAPRRRSGTSSGGPCRAGASGALSRPARRGNRPSANRPRRCRPPRFSDSAHRMPGHGGSRARRPQ